jgi:hypothetical protein
LFPWQRDGKTASAFLAAASPAARLKFGKFFETAKQRDIGEADTIIADILADALGYEQYKEVSSEHAILRLQPALREIESRLEFEIESAGFAPNVISFGNSADRNYPESSSHGGRANIPSSSQLVLGRHQRERTMAISHALFALSSIAAVLTGTSVQAQSIPPEGPVSVTFVATPIPAPKPMPIGGGKEYALLNQAMAASNDAGNPVLNNMGGRCQLTRLTDPSAKTAEVHGFCTYVDNEGDQIFEQCDFLPGAPNNCKVTGGTGKFEGLQAALVITISPLKGNFDGISQVVGHKKGTYRLVRPN